MGPLQGENLYKELCLPRDLGQGRRDFSYRASGVPHPYGGAPGFKSLKGRHANGLGLLYRMVWEKLRQCIILLD